MFDVQVDTLTSVLANLDHDGLDALSDLEVHDGLGELLAARSRLDAVIAAYLHEWTSRGIWREDGSRAAWARLARDAQLKKATAARAVKRAAALAEMPATREALAAGRIHADHVDVLAAANTLRRRQLFLDHESRLVEACVALPFWEAEQAIKYWCARADALLGDDGPEPSFLNRTATSHAGLDGELHLKAILDKVGGAEFKAAWDRIDNELRLHDQALLDHGAESVRTPSQRRADALVEMARRATANPNGAKPRPLVTVVVGDESFKHLCELSNGVVIKPGDLVPYLGELDVHTMIFNGPFHAVAGSNQRSFTGLVRRAIEVRDRRCQHPSSDGDPIDACDVDHIIAYAAGGVTCQCNGRLMERGRNRDPRRRNLTAADITLWNDDPVVAAAQRRLDDLIDHHPRPPNPN